MDKENLVQEVMLDDTYDVYELFIEDILTDILDKAYTLELKKLQFVLRFDNDKFSSIPILYMNLGKEMLYALPEVVAEEFLMLIKKMKGLKSIINSDEGYFITFDREKLEDFVNEEIQRLMYGDEKIILDTISRD